MGSKRRLVWITGASTGIGRELALQMANRNMRCAVTARSTDKLQALARSSNLIDVFPADVTDREGVAATVDRIEARLGAIDVAVLNAGVWVDMCCLLYTSDAADE